MSGMTREITAEVLSIGDELLIGQTVNTNAGWIGEQLSLIGIRPLRVRTIGDDRAGIVEAFATATCDVVVITGGLGPTKDDVTKEALCTFFNTRPVRRADVEAHILALFGRVGRTPLEMDRAQADLPEACTVLPNDRGTASGMWFEKDGRVFVSMPGVPYEMKGMMREQVLARLVERFHPPAIVHRTILTTGLGESPLAQRIADWEDSLAGEDIKLAYLPSPGLVRLRLSKYANNDAVAARSIVDRKVGELRASIAELVLGEGSDTLEQVIGDLLKAAGHTLSVAESCTGGYLSHLITSVPGSSAYYMGGVVSYASAVKMEELGVPGDMLELNGAVSRPVVERMATGIREALRTDWSIATSGIAGPDGGTAEKPVGTVWIAVAGPDGVRSVQGCHPGGRALIIRRSAMAALDQLRGRLRSYGEGG